jgi:hypothetical protein
VPRKNDKDDPLLVEVTEVRGSAEEAKQKRFELEDAMDDAGLAVVLTIKPVGRPEQRRWSIRYRKNADGDIPRKPV